MKQYKSAGRIKVIGFLALFLFASFSIASIVIDNNDNTDLQHLQDKVETINEETDDMASDRIPDIHIESDVYGNISPGDLKDKVVLVSLFATWCPPCQLELSEIENVLYPKYKDNENFKLLVIGREHTDEDLRKYNKQKNFSFPLYPDPDRKIFSLFADKSIPRMYLFNKQGILVHSTIGFSKEDFNELMNKIEECL